MGVQYEQPQSKGCIQHDVPKEPNAAAVEDPHPDLYSIAWQEDIPL